jgi:hypothetical protein
MVLASTGAKGTQTEPKRHPAVDIAAQRRLQLRWRRPMEVSMPGKLKQHAEDERKRIELEEDEVTINSDESFPASDSPSFNPGITGSNEVKKKHS